MLSLVCTVPQRRVSEIPGRALNRTCLDNNLRERSKGDGQPDAPYVQRGSSCTAGAQVSRKQSRNVLDNTTTVLTIRLCYFYTIWHWLLQNG